MQIQTNNHVNRLKIQNLQYRQTHTRHKTLDYKDWQKDKNHSLKYIRNKK